VNRMQKNKIGIFSCTLLLLSACGTTAPTPSPSPTTSPAVSVAPVASTAPSLAASPTDTAAMNSTIANDRYQEALNTAAAARAVTETAMAKEDWSLVADRWQESVKLLKMIPKNSINYPLAMKILPQYQQNLSYARQKAINYKSPSSEQKDLETTKKGNKAEKKDPNIESIKITQVDQSQTFSLPIVAKNNNVPIVEVVINGRDRVQMMLDTGASKTLLTKGVAERLKLASQGKTTAKTANGNAEFDTVKLDSLEFGSGKVTNLTVAVGDNNLNYGLLGHDVYNGYDITLTEDSVQFKKR
jgi:clan AA aspartic protease (TIGR02281 family)